MILLSLFIVLLFALGGWWLYIIKILSENPDQIFQGRNISSMLFWEGGTFFLLLLVISCALAFFYLKGLKNSQAMMVFFSSLTHELKTPLASLRLQSEVANDLIEQLDNPQLQGLSKKMISDTLRLEMQMDKVLQLSRMELAGNLNLVTIDLYKFIKKKLEKLKGDNEVDLQVKTDDAIIWADEFALELILKNFIENTRRHSKSEKSIVTIENGMDDFIKLTYSDYGNFKGDKKKLGNLFYKHNSSQGAGIGLYLIKKMMKKMDGVLRFNFDPSFVQILEFRRVKEID